MPEYVVEVMGELGGEDQVDAFEAPNLSAAIRIVKLKVNEVIPLKCSIEERVSSAYITFPLPYGQKITYMVGETGRSD
ncbi:MAG TPA: hypothetical protein PKJ51_09405 [Methanothrix sp.]|nr:hypothetical protein [Methanothrix sp.]